MASIPEHNRRQRPRPDMLERLRNAGVTPTPQRVAIAEVMLGRCQHLSADQLIARLRRDNYPQVSKATVYNTLGLFARVGLVREVIADPSRVFYDSNVDDHHHIYNVEAGTLTDIEPNELAIDRLPSLPQDLDIDGVDIIVRVRPRRR